MIIATITFYLFSFTLLLSALMVITASNPVKAVLFLILAFFSSSGLFVLLGAEFLAMLMVIVYVGAVAVLFLFVVMMINIDFALMRKNFIKHLPLAILLAVIMFVQLNMVLNVGFADRIPESSAAIVANSTNALVPVIADISNTVNIARILYTDYMFTFQLSGLILLVAMIGAIILTLRVRAGVKKQKVFDQVARSREDSIEIVKVKSGTGV